MSTQQLFIPDKIKVGFQKREGTYTGKLAYVIYYDQKGELRKERSWNSWRDNEISDGEFTNEPVAGFVLNKNVGGYKSDWNYRSAHIRVYDPRDFEFEISVENLLFILRECDCSRGKGLEGKFVYAWDGTELVLLPEKSADYKNSKNYTELQSHGVKAKELIAGASYTTKNQETLIYLGRYDYHTIVEINSWRTRKKDTLGVYKQYVFWSPSGRKPHFVFLDNVKTIAKLNCDSIANNYAELVDKYYKLPNGSKVVELFTQSEPNGSPVKYWRYNYEYFVVKEGDFYVEYCARIYEKERPYSKSKIEIDRKYRYTLNVEGILSSEYIPSYNVEAIAGTDRLYARLESGSVFKVQNSSLVEVKNGGEEDSD